MPIPPKERFFEDFQPGEVFEFGDYAVTEAEIIEFAKRYDPQAFHVDPKAGAESVYGGLIASGWMTGAVMMRILVDEFLSPASFGSPGVDEIRWLKPVRPGDRLHVRLTVVYTKRSQSKPDRGVVQVQQEMINQDGDPVMSLRGMSMYMCRSPQPPDRV